MFEYDGVIYDSCEVYDISRAEEGTEWALSMIRDGNDEHTTVWVCDDELPELPAEMAAALKEWDREEEAYQREARGEWRTLYGGGGRSAVA